MPRVSLRPHLAGVDRSRSEIGQRYFGAAFDFRVESELRRIWPGISQSVGRARIRPCPPSSPVLGLTRKHTWSTSADTVLAGHPAVGPCCPGAARLALTCRARFRCRSARASPNSAEVAQVWSTFCQIWSTSGLHGQLPGRYAKLSQIRARTGQTTSLNFRLENDIFRQSGQHWPHLTEIVQLRAQIGRIWPTCGPDQPDVVRLGQHMSAKICGQHRLNLANLFAQFRTNAAEFCVNTGVDVAQSGPSRANFGRK